MLRHFLRITLAASALAAAFPAGADEKVKPDNREILGTDQVTVYFCPCLKANWTQTADTTKSCPYCEKDAATCGSAVGDYKVVVRAVRGTVKNGAEAALDVEVFQIVVDKDAKPDEVRVTDVAVAKAKLSHGSSKDGDFVADEEGKVQEASVGGEKKIATVKAKLKKGEYVMAIEINRGDKEKTKIESEVTFRVD
ncbi:MAG: hypothetical protein FD180_208 [Planctomycetota bacterium]|nr:MAG: hypothetical protein FD180_208 [Planctomycetota bacterium]